MKHRLLFATLLALFSSRSPLYAAATPWKTNAEGQVRLVSALDSVAGAGELLLGLEFRPAPGWYVYWKQAGDAGYPPKVSWEGSEGLKTPELLWPRPTKFILPGSIVEYGYEKEIVYPIRAEIRASGNRLRAQATVSYLTCNTSCVPYKYTLTLDLPVGQAQKNAGDEALIRRYLAQVPAPGQSDEAVKASAPVQHKQMEEETGAAVKTTPLSWILLLAFLGGMILNVMPCVLPVLSIKLTGLLQHANQSRAEVVKSALASATGIIVSFLGLALAAVVTRQAGHAIGWGVQFQNSGFVVFLMIMVLVFAVNLWGAFEIPMPRMFGHFAKTFGYHETLTAHFLSGLFATLLATPCSAPFLGTAMGFALAQSAGVIFAIFAASGAGLASPYLLLAVFPQSIHWLPKPGAWMLHLKKILAFLLLVTAAWLGWVLVQQVSPAHRSEASKWVPFDESAIERYRQEGKPVFVDVTADWCVTCKYNERFVLNAPDVARELERRGIILMKADWTNRDAAIAAYLMKHGRAGIPFYALYTPHHEPVLLSEFLTQKKVLDALHVGDTLQ